MTIIIIPKWMEITISVVIAFGIIVSTYVAYTNWNRLQDEKKYVRKHGKECIKNAVKFGDGYWFSVCKGEDRGVGEWRIVYDTSGQIGIAPELRTNEWRYMYLNNESIFTNSFFQGSRIEGDFYSVFIDYANSGDPYIIDLEKKMDCDYVMVEKKRVLECKNLNVLK